MSDTKMKLAIIGRERDISRAEVESVCRDAGAEAGGAGADFEHFSDAISLLTTDRGIDRFGGIVALGEVLVRQARPDQILVRAEQQISEYLRQRPPASGKITFGLSIYGDPKVDADTLTRAGLTIKKILKQADLSSRFVLPKTTSLSAAQMKFNHLLAKGFHFVIALNQSEIILARITEIQDIDWYSGRDYGRPCRDARVGMLPPKLAQIMLNLASPKQNDLVVDPFCGTGVVLAEALLWGHPVYGSDIEAKMIEYSRQNLDWLASKRPNLPVSKLAVADARQIKLPDSPSSVIVSEGYLGPVDSFPSSTQKAELTKLYEDFFTNIAAQQSTGQCVVLCLPAWQHQNQNQIETLPILDRIGDFGYNSMVFSGQIELPLIYRREQQRVGRQILALIRNNRNNKK